MTEAKYPTLTYNELVALDPCRERFDFVKSKIGNAKTWNGKRVNAREAVAAGVSFGDLVWVASAKARTDKDVERKLRMWAADCAARVLHIFEKHVPGDARPRKAIEAARLYANGEIDDAAWDAAGAAAWVAARAADWDADWAAGAAAWDAAGAAAGAAAGDAAWDAAGAAARAVAWDAAKDAEETWQLERLVLWLTDEPEPLALPEFKEVV